MGRLTGSKNKTRIEVTLSSWYGDKIRELRANAGFETDQGFATWLLKSAVQIAANEREPENQNLSDLRLRMEQALGSIQEPAPECTIGGNA
tara:strand:+ start:460 stop:732 length:273 start_codon:yes stop_codon:yes gene_type:complete